MNSIKKHRTTPAFTLIELIVVIAIISILTLLGIYNMMESSIRAKVARTKNDMRVIAGAMEAYHVDNNTYVSFLRAGPGALFDRIRVPMTYRLSPLSTPVSYISRVPIDVFETVTNSDGSPLIFFDTYDYADVASLQSVGSPKGAGATSGGMWRLASAGPDRIQAYGGDTAANGTRSLSNTMGVDYDPTNGTVSAGDIVRIGPPSEVGMSPAIRRTNGYEELFRTN